MLDEEYILNRGCSQSVRLNLQHYIFKETLGYELSPHLSSLPTNARIADVGTGTGYLLQFTCLVQYL